MDNLIAKLYQSPKTVFTNKDMALIWQETDKNNLKSKTAYYAKKGDLIKLTRGVFAKDKNYNLKELAASLYFPSYISFETVLREAGIIFQYYESIFVAGPWPKTIKINNNIFTFRKLKDEILYNPSGVVMKNNYCFASPERAFLDMIYLFPDYYFDNLSGLDWEKCFELVKIYKNKQLLKRLDNYYKNYAKPA
jgi:hypothetical protein